MSAFVLHGKRTPSGFVTRWRWVNDHFVRFISLNRAQSTPPQWCIIIGAAPGVRWQTAMRKMNYDRKREINEENQSKSLHSHTHSPQVCGFPSTRHSSVLFPVLQFDRVCVCENKRQRLSVINNTHLQKLVPKSTLKLPCFYIYYETTMIFTFTTKH